MQSYIRTKLGLSKRHSQLDMIIRKIDIEKQIGARKEDPSSRDMEIKKLRSRFIDES